MPSSESRPRAMSVELPEPQRQTRVREWAEGLGGALPAAIILALLIRVFLVQAFKIPSGSMLPTLQIGDHILVNKFIYGARLEIPFTSVSFGQLPRLRKPQRGDIVVFLYPGDRSKDYIKRVVAVEGETIEVRSKRVFIDGTPWDDLHATFVERGGYLSAPRDNYGPYQVPPGKIFVMGDNRDQSFDSRFWGPVPIVDVKGLALIIYWSWDSKPGGGWLVRWDRLGRLVY